MKTLDDLEPLLVKVGATRKNGATWIERVEMLRNALPATLPGQPRQFLHYHAVHLVVMAAIVVAGAEPREAVRIAASIARSAKGSTRPAREWLVFARGDFSKSTWTDAPDSASLIERFGLVPMSLIPVGTIVRMIDELYAEA